MRHKKSDFLVVLENNGYRWICVGPLKEGWEKAKEGFGEFESMPCS
jgi:hypothetical protein